jgi:hypothetical protein
VTTYRFPFNGPHPVTSPYGPRSGGFHAGTDFGWLPDEGPSFEVVAAADGDVIYYADEGEGGGRTMTLAHEGGEQSRYFHLDHPVVAVGAHVVTGQPIAWSGNTGGVAPHLHFELLDGNGNHYDPMTVLGRVDAPAVTDAATDGDERHQPSVEVDVWVMVCDGFRPVVVDATLPECYEVSDIGTAPHVTVDAMQRKYIIDDVRAKAAARGVPAGRSIADRE